ncbi:MAG: SAM-dependent methyltransferase [Salinivirgaceae bacterium]|nr:MAG: SAM-dependent methyltransferase [Salinivirgaceae bacterium]
MAGKLFLLPMLLGDSSIDLVIPHEVKNQIISLDTFFAENIKTTRRFLRKIDKTFNIDGSTFIVLDKKSDHAALSEMLQIIKNGKDAGIISEAGLPGIGDPGSKLVEMAHKENIQVIPLTGPSSFVLALVASGLNGQSFAFHGYLPVKQPQLDKQIKDIERISGQQNQTQIFMETPYRNNQMLKQLIESCHPGTMLCIASNITTSEEYIKTKTIQEWKKTQIDLHKKPTVFALLKQNR